MSNKDTICSTLKQFGSDKLIPNPVLQKIIWTSLGYTFRSKGVKICKKIDVIIPLDRCDNSARDMQLYEIIDKSFAWHYTPEGHDYWSIIYKKIRLCTSNYISNIHIDNAKLGTSNSNKKLLEIFNLPSNEKTL